MMDTISIKNNSTYKMVVVRIDDYPHYSNQSHIITLNPSKGIKELPIIRNTSRVTLRFENV